MNIEELKKVIIYDPLTGVFRWSNPTSNKHKAGDVAGTCHGNGYRRVTVLGARVFEHRLAWFYMTGAWPRNDIDHVNGVRDDNRWENLRAATRAENNLNLRGRAKSNSMTGALGVTMTKSGTFFARIKFSGKAQYLGSFSSKEEAASAYAAALERVMQQRG